MKNRLILLLAALGIVATGAALATSSLEQPQAVGCYYVVSFTPYPHQVLYCPPNGGGSW